MQTKTRAKLEDLGLSTKVYRTLYTRHRIDFVDEVESMSEQELLYLREIGDGAVAEIKAAIAAWQKVNHG
jgi:DNA-directed RNA polymerase alpha subunit